MSERKAFDTLAEALADYRRQAVQGDVPPFLDEMIEQTFYAGAHAVFAGMYSQPTADAASDVGSRMTREIVEYQEQARLRHSPARGSA